jgi:hypothetical protein
VVREQGRYVQKASAGKEFAQEIPSVLPQGEAGLSGVTQFGIRNVEFGILCFLFSIPHSAIGIPHLKARPAQERRVASWFLRLTPLLPGRATPGIQSIFRPLGEK